jgi:Choline/Carnitine o-acyltransferase
MFGRPGVTYESAQTRKYQLGRTEVIRSASKESKAWAEAMLDPKQQVRPRFFNLKSLEIQIENPHYFIFSRTPYPSVSYSLKPYVNMFNTQHGQLMVKASIVISSDSRKC